MFGRRASLRAVLSFGHSDDQSDREEAQATPEPQAVDAQPGYATFIRRAQFHLAKGSANEACVFVRSMLRLT